MRSLIAFDLLGGQHFVDQLSQAWENGDAVFPIDQRLPLSAKQALVEAIRPTHLLSESGLIALPNGLTVEDNDAIVIATSGSSGPPKGAILTHDAILSSAKMTSMALDVGVDDHWLACLPLAHIGGLSVVMRSLLLGIELTVLPQFDAQAVTTAARQCTLTSLVPTALRRIDPRIFRSILLGGSKPPVDRPANAIATYGMTETGSGIAYEGRLLPGVEITITTEAEILVRSPSNMRAYRNAPTTIDTENWLHTGDVGRLDDDGTLIVDGRIGDVIVTGGDKVWPEVVESALRDFIGHENFAIVGKDDDEWGQQVTLVLGDSQISLAEVRAYLTDRLPNYCLPKELIHLDEIPRSAIGKIRRSVLANIISA